MEAAFPFVGVKLSGLQAVAELSELFEPVFVFRPILFFKFFAEALRESGTFARRGNGDLQCSALHHGRIIEIAQIRHVHDVAQDAALCGFTEDSFMECGG